MQENVIDHISNLYTLDGAARALGVTFYMVVNYVRRNKVPTVKLGGKATLVLLSDLEGLRSK